jgi:hypothetical protein
LKKLPVILVKALGHYWRGHEFAALNHRKTIPVEQITCRMPEVVCGHENNAPFDAA